LDGEIIKEQSVFKNAIAKTLNKATELAILGTDEATAKVAKDAFEAGVAEMGGLAPVVVVLLRDHAIDGVFDILVKVIPGGVLLAGAIKLLFKSTIEKFSEVMQEKGEPYLMNTIAEIWQDKTVDLEGLRGGIGKIPDSLVKADVKKEALLLVDKYHLSAGKE
jgi:hypothetical protein